MAIQTAKTVRPIIPESSPESDEEDFKFLQKDGIYEQCRTLSIPVLVFRLK